MPCVLCLLIAAVGGWHLSQPQQMEAVRLCSWMALISVLTPGRLGWCEKVNNKHRTWWNLQKWCVLSLTDTLLRHGTRWVQDFYVLLLCYVYRKTLQWHHDGRDGVSNHRHLKCLLNLLLRCRSKKTSKLRVTGLCEGKSPMTSEFPSQRASNTENVSIWWCRHIDNKFVIFIFITFVIHIAITRTVSYGACDPNLGIAISWANGIFASYQCNFLAICYNNVLNNLWVYIYFVSLAQCLGLFWLYTNWLFLKHDKDVNIFAKQI